MSAVDLLALTAMSTNDVGIVVPQWDGSPGPGAIYWRASDAARKYHWDADAGHPRSSARSPTKGPS